MFVGRREYEIRDQTPILRTRGREVSLKGKEGCIISKLVGKANHWYADKFVKSTDKFSILSIKIMAYRDTNTITVKQKHPTSHKNILDSSK